MRHTSRAARLRCEQENAPRHDVIVKGNSHHCVADSLKYGCCNYKRKNLHGEEIVSRHVHVDNLFRLTAKVTRTHGKLLLMKSRSLNHGPSAGNST
jgi:hypothetical protein